MHNMNRGLLMASASGIAGLASFVLFGLQPLTIGTMDGWHSPASVMQFFQSTYLLGVLLAAATVKLTPKTDILLAAALFFPIATYTLVFVIPDGPQRLGDVAPIAVWLASTTTVMVRALGAALPTRQLQPYFIFAVSNAGALSGVLLWLQPTPPAIAIGWLTAAAALAIIGLSLLLLLHVTARLPTSCLQGNGAASPRLTCHAMYWFLLAMSASLALVVVYKLLAVHSQPAARVASMPVSISAMPLLIFLLAYVVSWLPRSANPKRAGVPGAIHALSVIIVTAVTAAVSPAAMTVLLALYLFCATCAEALRRLAPPPAFATRFQVVQAFGGAFGGWLASLVWYSVSEY